MQRIITPATVSTHSHRCARCKHIVNEMLRSLYGEVEVDPKIDAPAKLEDYQGQDYYGDLRRIHRVLQRYRGHTDFVRRQTLPRCDFRVVEGNFVVELDEVQHFTAARSLTFRHYPRRLHLGFSARRWQNLCDSIKAKDNEPIDRDEQRAWYDTLRDFLPLIKGLKPTARLFMRDYHWCSLSPRKASDLKIFEGLFRGRGRV